MVNYEDMSMYDIENALFTLVVMVSGLVLVTLFVLHFRTDGPKISRKAWGFVAAPSVIMLGLFYSLAIHMYQALGGWPKTIGNGGFSKDLLWHTDIAGNVFGGLFFFTLFILPVVFLVAVFIRRFRGVMPYLSAYVVTFGISFGMMLLAPSGFLNWWWD